ncbi:phosphoribosylamine--glycine ligase [Alphaproteobacteria bacterium]|nr:phosphoribosylamine--glycine ligase [Alphaproteobacteria bacterium]
MNILVIGSGGREHSLCWAIKKSPLLNYLFCAPGNPGISELAKCINIDINDNEKILNIAIKHKIDLVIIGPEKPLENGIIDLLKKNNITAFGPTKKAAKLESSKVFTKDFCKKYNIPTAKYEYFSDSRSAKNYIKKCNFPIVIKADGLASGKGVIISDTYSESVNFIDKIFNGLFGEAGKTIIIEEFLEGEEASFFVLCDGKSILPLTSAQDHKRVGDGDTGLNTGGMGAYSPAPIIDSEMEEKIVKKIIKPTVDGMNKEGSPFHGVLYAGLMISNGTPKLIEYNVRFGDPECQTLMTRLKSDLISIIMATCNSKLSETSIVWKNDFSLIVIMASKGYPEKFQNKTLIKGLENLNNKNINLFHSGTKKIENKIFSSGGRVLGLVANSKSIEEAQRNVYDSIKKIDWPEGFYRKDIGWRAIQFFDKKTH